MCLVGRTGRIRARTEIELGEPFATGLIAVRDLVETVLHICGELVVHVLGELRLEQPGHGEGEPAGDQRTPALVHIPAVDDRRDDVRVRRRTADLLGLQGLHKRRFGVACRRLRLMAVCKHALRRQFGALGERRQRRALLALLARAAALAGHAHEAGEFDHRARRLERRLAESARRCRKARGGGGTGGIGHLRGERALPDQRVQLELIGRQRGELRGIAEVRAGGANALVRLLRARGLRRILLGLFGKVL